MAAPVQVDADKQSVVNAGGGNKQCVLTTPTNLADGDVLYACLARDGDAASDAVTTPSGWTKIGGSEIDNGTFMTGIYRKVIPTASSEPSTYTWSWTNNEKNVGWIVRVTGADNTTPEDVVPSNNTGTSTAPRCLAVTTITADTLLFAVGGEEKNDANDWAPPSGMTERFDLATGGGGDAVSASSSMAEVDQASIGATGDKDFTTTSFPWVCFLIAVRPEAGGTLFFQTNTGAITPTGAVAKEAQKAIAGVLTPAGLLVREIQKAVAGVLTPAGALVKETLKVLAGALTPTGIAAGIRIIVKAVGGALTPTGALTKETQKNVAGSVTPAGIIIRDILKALAGALTPTGALTKETQKNVAGSVTPTGIVSAIIIFLRTVTGSLTPTGAITKQTQKNVAGVIAPSGDIVKETQKNVAGAIAPTGAVAKETQKNVDGSVTPSGFLATAAVFGKTVLGALAPIGALATLFIEGGAPAVIKFLRRTLSLIRVTHHRNTKQR